MLFARISLRPDTPFFWRGSLFSPPHVHQRLSFGLDEEQHRALIGARPRSEAHAYGADGRDEARILGGDGAVGGCVGLRAEDPNDVDAVIDKALSINDAPVVVEFVVHKDAMVWPMVAAGTSNDEIKVARDMAPIWDGETL